MTAQQVKKLRMRLKLSQTKFAQKLGVSRRTAQGWESEKNRHAPSQMAVRMLEGMKAPEPADEEMPP